MKLLYQIFIFIYPIIAKCISPIHVKAKLWVIGRKEIFKKLNLAFENNTSAIVWMHCSSLGEFEQGRPLIEALKKNNSSLKIVLTFFSPSGYEVQKNYSFVDWVFYLPIDSKKNAKKFFSIVRPSAVFFVKYEFWNYYLQESKKRKIPLFLISGVFRNTQPFFKWYGNFYRKMLPCFNYFFLQNNTSFHLIQSLGYNNAIVCGDTRFDRVIAIANNWTSNKMIDEFINAQPVIVAGSTWLEDDEELCHYVNNHPEIKFIIAPHTVDESRIKECILLYKNAIRYSEYTTTNLSNKNVLIIDNIGMLSQLYKYASIAYVGGAFGEDGVHNVLEAAVYYKPVVFGPEFEKYQEAIDLLECGGGFSINNALELENTFNKLLANKDAYELTCNKAGNFVVQQSGATEKIMNYIQENLRLTN